LIAGNGKGTFGYTLSAGKYGKNPASMRRAVNKAGLRLLTVQLHENRTVFHDFFTQYGSTRIVVRQASDAERIF
jgi:small subunit ribosomal protein S5